jgi:hypothetical protein
MLNLLEGIWKFELRQEKIKGETPKSAWCDGCVRGLYLTVGIY